MVGMKRGGVEVGERLNLEPKRVKMRDLDSVFRSEGAVTHHVKRWENKKVADLSHSAEKEVYQVTEDTVYSTAFQSGKTGKDSCQILVSPASVALALSANIDTGSNVSSVDDRTGFADSTKLTIYTNNAENLRDFCVHPNAEDVSSSVYHGTINPDICNDQLKERDATGHVSTSGPLEEKDPMKVWKQMKQNGFMSCSHGSGPVPKPSGKKSKAEAVKRKMETARREQVDRFATIAPPSGLLNELNPGIINCVRNSRQVRSTIEALVRSEIHENCCDENKSEVIQNKTERIESRESKAMENLNWSRMNTLNLNTSSGSRQTSNCPMASEYTEVDNGSLVEKRICDEGNSFPSSELKTEDNIVTLKQSIYAAMTSENLSSLSSENSVNQTTLSSLSLNAANATSQWLELLHQDIKGRLAALQRSKKRVRAVIETELPILLSREFSSNQENAPCHKLSVSGPASTTADVHKARWSALFDQMDRSLDVEEKQLESWLNQVNTMQLHCDNGVRRCTGLPGIQQSGTSVIDFRLQKEGDSQRALADRAAAAAFYSTCNFVQLCENLSSCSITK